MPGVFLGGVFLPGVFLLADRRFADFGGDFFAIDLGVFGVLGVATVLGLMVDVLAADLDLAADLGVAASRDGLETTGVAGLLRAEAAVCGVLAAARDRRRLMTLGGVLKVTSSSLSSNFSSGICVESAEVSAAAAAAGAGTGTGTGSISWTRPPLRSYLMPSWARRSMVRRCAASRRLWQFFF